MIVLVCGDRHYTDEKRVHEALYALDRINGIAAVVEGCAPGADHYAETWARQNEVMLCHFPALWEKYGKAAGAVRNRKMLAEGRPELVLAFHDNIAESRGTADMIRQARRAGVPVRLYTRDGVEGVGG